MATIMQLPHEVIVHILQNESISAVDLIRFGSTCTRLQQVIHDNKLCERKYYQSCPTAEKKYNRENQKKIFHHINFKERLEAGLYYIQKLQYYAIMISQNKLCNTDKEQLERLLGSITEDSTTYYFVWDEINGISAQKSCKLFSNLTSEYYLKLIFYCLKRYRFVYKQMKFINMPNTKELLEKQLTIVAQCFQPHVSYSAVKTWLDEIVQTVLFRLKNKYLAHSICSTALEQFSF
ncbi:F-box only protein 21-like [Formica exsecta]|uniref:F-box only protein 21-like n=1 Tax=Formica exsecta TaxID=72781 RepID=UPI0011424C02|nr:F-box only protein 21-like [Formica exsecta]